MSAPRVAFVNLGCRVNRVEVDLIAQELARAGCVIVKPEEADAVVVNTCAVTAEAEAKTRKVVRRAASLGQVPVVVATGCVASLFSDELASIAPNVTVEADKSRGSWASWDCPQAPSATTESWSRHPRRPAVRDQA